MFVYDWDEVTRPSTDAENVFNSSFSNGKD